MSANDSVLALSDLSFDLSVYDIFGMLAVGGTIVIPPQEKNRDPAHWLCMVRRHRITIWNSVPQLAELLADEAENSWQQLESLRLYLLSGDWLPLNLPDRLRGLSKEGLVISLGGATEGSIWSIWYHIATVDPGWRSIPYGTAMPNQQVLVLDSAGDPCPFGVVGEIYIGGVGVAHGYWRSEELTLKHFVNHPQWGRLYKTGDLGRWSKSGYIEFLGRHDAQVKLNGYRVELEDIENNLNKLPGIRQALVRKISRGRHWELAAHVVPTANQPVPLYFANRQDFVLAHGSMQPGVESSYSLAYPLEEELYLARKSVRQFAHDPLPQESVEQLCAAVLPGHQSQPGRELAEEQLRSLLSVCAALQVSDHALPKYRYPSAGRTYALQLHLGLPRNMGHYAKGYYRYNPLEQTLCVSALPTQCHQNESPYLDLIISWEAIEALYPNRAFAFAHIEAGHMLALLTDRLGELGVVYQLQHPLEDAVAPGHSLACRLLFGRLGNDILPLPPSVRLSFMVRQGESYLHRQSGASYELESSSVLTAASDVSSILQQAQILVQIHGESTLRNYQECGWLLQYISIAALKQNIGSCLLGLTPSSDSLCSLVLGYIRQEDISSYVVPAKTISMASVINRHLAKRLPDYMLPQHYLLISELPLSSNGKVDASRLPDFVPTTQLVAPHSTGERRIQELWAELLVLDREEVGCDQSFFSIGGNSLQAMNLVRKIKLVLGADIRLDDLYQYNTVQKLATIIAKKSCNYDRETGSI